jgi:hypothetical protein
MKYTYSELERRIVMAVRERAKQVPRFADKKEGCIRITAYPECEEAHEWLGCNGIFNPDDIQDVERTYPILPGGTRVARFENDDGTVDIVDTYAITAMKIAQLSYVQDRGELLSGGKIDGLELENGFACWKGAICCEITLWKNINGQKVETSYCSIYVAVSGASEEEDLRTAMAAPKLIEDCFSYSNLDFVIYPPFDAD